MLLCSDNSLYTGISNDVAKRIDKHLNSKGAKYFRGREPVELVYLESGHNRSTATKREAQIKRLGRNKKLELLTDHNNEASLYTQDISRTSL